MNKLLSKFKKLTSRDTMKFMCLKMFHFEVDGPKMIKSNPFRECLWSLLELTKTHKGKGDFLGDHVKLVQILELFNSECVVS